MYSTTLDFEMFTNLFFFLKRLIFLIRDWACPGVYEYGQDKKEGYVYKQLGVSKELEKF